MADISEKSFIRPGKVILLILLGLIVYVVAVVATIPAGWVWKQVSENVPLPDNVTVNSITGTVWSGAIGLTALGKPISLDWHMGWINPFALSVPLDLDIAIDNSRLEGSLAVSYPGDIRFNAQGNVNVSDWSDQIAASGGAMIEGNVTIETLGLTFENGRVTDGQGRATWPGGTVTWPQGLETQSANFPPMEMTLVPEADRLVLEILEQNKPNPVAAANIYFDGMLEASAYYRLVVLAGQALPGLGQPDDVVFRIRQPLMPGGF